MKNTARYLLRITCPGRTGLVAAITGFWRIRNVLLQNCLSLMIFRLGVFSVEPSFLSRTLG